MTYRMSKTAYMRFRQVSGGMLDHQGVIDTINREFRLCVEIVEVVVY